MARTKNLAFALAVSVLGVCMAVHVVWFAVGTVRPDLIGIDVQTRQPTGGPKEVLVVSHESTLTSPTCLFWLVLETACAASAIYVLLAIRRPQKDNPASPSESAPSVRA